MQRAGTIMALVALVLAGPVPSAAGAGERLVVKVERVELRALPNASAPVVPGSSLARETPVEVLQEQGSWAKVSVKSPACVGWIRTRQLIRVDPSKIRSDEPAKPRGVAALFQGSDQTGYGSAAAARGISSLGKAMQNQQVFSDVDATQADIVTAYRISGVPANSNRAMRAEVLRQKVDAFLREGGLGDYLP